MRTAQEMYDYCLTNNYGQGLTKKWVLKHFDLIADTLQPTEDVKMCFIGLHNYVSPTKHDQNFAFAITDKRFIIAQKRVIGQAIQTVMLDQINDVTYASGVIFATITFDTLKERFNVGVNKSVGQSINNVIHDVVWSVKKGVTTPAPTPSFASAPKTMTLKEKTETIKELKELLDSGALTQTEFDQQKAQILNS